MPDSENLKNLSGSPQGAGGVGGLLSIVASSGGARYYPAYDGNGNVSQYVSQTGAEVARFEYDPFGNLTVDAYSNATSFPYRFSTKPQDGVTGLYYYGYRWFDPVTGRWPSRDPIEEEGGVNFYGFVGNDGTGRTDLLGLSYLDAFPIRFREWVHSRKQSPDGVALGDIDSYSNSEIDVIFEDWVELGLPGACRTRCEDPADMGEETDAASPPITPEKLDDTIKELINSRISVTAPNDPRIVFPQIDARTGIVTRIDPDGCGFSCDPDSGGYCRIHDYLRDNICIAGIAADNVILEAGVSWRRDERKSSI